MNIFASSRDPIESAQALDDKRVVKMTTETAQLLSCSLRLLGHGALADERGLYKLTHAHHPLLAWSCRTRGNYAWLCEHGLALGAEYTLRYGRVHASERVIGTCQELAPLTGSDGEVTEFANCARHLGQGIDFSHIEDVTVAYRSYLNARWPRDKRAPAWTNVGPPAWAAYEHGSTAAHESVLVHGRASGKQLDQQER